MTDLLTAAFRGLTSPLRLTPDFIIIGTQRGGTTSLYSYLTERPCVVPASVKEVHYADDNFHKGPLWYRAHFPTVFEKAYSVLAKGQPFVTGEGSPYYMFHPLAARRLARSLPHVKLIVLLRNPVDRAYSQYCLQVQEKLESLPFEEAVAREEERIRGEDARLAADGRQVSFNYRHYSYLARGVYADQLQLWLSLFPREQFLILKSEDLYQDPAAVLERTLAFLGVPPAFLEERPHAYPRHNAAHQAGDGMSQAMRQYLADFFAPHNARLYQLLGRDLSWA